LVEFELSDHALFLVIQYLSLFATKCKVQQSAERKRSEEKNNIKHQNITNAQIVMSLYVLLGE